MVTIELPAEPGEALRRQAWKRPVAFLFFVSGIRGGGVACLGAEFAGGTGRPSRLCQEGKRKLTESAKEFPKEFRLAKSERAVPEALKRKGMPPRLRKASTGASPLSPLSFPVACFRMVPVILP